MSLRDEAPSTAAQTAPAAEPATALDHCPVNAPHAGSAGAKVVGATQSVPVEDTSVAGEEDPGASLGAIDGAPSEVYRPTPVATERPAGTGLANLSAGLGPGPGPATGSVRVIEKTATVHWESTGQQGQGRISIHTDALKPQSYDFGSRFDGDPRGTNPEEMLAAAHAACFAMAFSLACDKAGFATESVDTQADVRLAQDGERFLIDRIALRLSAVVPGLDEVRFQQIAEQAKRECPMSKALASVPVITLQAVLTAA